jgi:hypothetical protein
VGFVVDKVALRQVFSEYFVFLCQLLFHRLLHTHLLSSGAGTIGQLVADVPSGLSLTPPQETRKKIELTLGSYIKYDIGCAVLAAKFMKSSGILRRVVRRKSIGVLEEYAASIRMVEE